MTGVRGVTAVAVAVCALLAARPSVESAVAQEGALRIVVIEGDDSVNIIEGETTVPTRVEVRDGEDRPLPGASVQFRLEEDDPATLNDGLQQVTVTTDARGQVTVTVNPTASGAAQLTVTTTLGGQTATVVIVHTNFATVAEAEAAGVEAPADAGGDPVVEVDDDPVVEAGDAAEADGGLGTGALVGILGGVGAAVGVGVAVAGGGSSPSPLPPRPVPSASVPSAPSRPTLTPGDRQLGVSWTAPASNGAAITDYDVRYRQTGVVSWTGLDGQFLDRRATITGLTNGMIYEVQARAGNSVGDGPWSASASGTPVASAASQDRAALVEFYNATNGANWTNNTNWNSSAPLDQWYGVSTDSNGRVTYLYLNDNQLTGSIPSSLGSLTNLEYLYLPNNQLTGSIPSSLGSLTKLTELDLFNNQLTGSIPSSLGSLTNLEYLYLSDNQLTGSIPSSLGSLTNLEYLYLSDNQLTGSIPAALCRFMSTINPQQGGVNLPCSESAQDRAALVEFYNATDGANWINNTNWNSSAPLDQWHGVDTENGRVTRLVLSENGLSGHIPSSLGGLTNLWVLELSDNGFGGAIPSDLGNLSDLRFLNLSYNQLSGSIPSSLGDLTNLVTLSLAVNDHLSGSIPSSFGSLTNLEHLDLVLNDLSGSIPSFLGDLTNLWYLSLADNDLSGSIPSSLGSLTNLKNLYLSDNDLSGSIPSSLGNLTNLDDLYLYENDLSGSIPSSLGSLTNLKNLYLWSNQLSGSIPTALCKFVDTINPQQDDVVLPCAGSANATAASGLSVADADAAENVDDTMEFAVTLDQAARGTVSVDYATVDGSAQAGADYIARSGTLTFSPGERSKTVQVAILDDAHDEGVETFTLALSNASGAVIGDGQATGRIDNHDPLPRALVARFGRAAAVHVVEQVEERLQAPREPGFEGRLGGQELRRGMERDLALGFLSQLGGSAGQHPDAVGVHDPLSGSAGAGAASFGIAGLAGGASLPAVGPVGAAAGSIGAGAGLDGGLNGGGFLDMGVGRGDMLTGSAFAVNRETRHGGVLSFWSRGAQSSFMGREGALALDGNVRTTMFGADYAKGPLVVGLSLANSRGLGSYAGVDDGRMASSVTGLYPWLGYKATDRVTVWGVAGYGAGAVMLAPGGGPALESGLSMAMAAGGTRGELIAGGSGGFGLAFKADALWVGTSVDGVDGSAGRLAATEAAVTRFRTGLEGSREFLLAGRVSLRPSAEVGLRHDGGDAETGAGMDVGGGLIVSDSSTGLAVDVRVRMLVVHQAEGFRERGMAVSLSYNPTPSTPLGFMARVAPSWGGQATSGAEALWGGETMAGPADASFASGNRLDTEVGYGLPVGSRFVGTPRMGFAASEHGRDYRMGYGLTLLERETLSFELGVDARRRDSSMQAGADNGFLGRATLGW